MSLKHLLFFAFLFFFRTVVVQVKLSREHIQDHNHTYRVVQVVPAPVVVMSLGLLRAPSPFVV